MTTPLSEKTSASQTSRLLSLWLPVIAWMTLIFLLSHQDKEESQGIGDFFVMIFEFLRLDPLQMEAWGVPHLIRKCAHVFEYCVLFLLMHRLIHHYHPKPASLWYSLAICAFYAATDEYHQTFIPGRAGQLADVGIDTFGATLALLWRRRWYRDSNA